MLQLSVHAFSCAFSNYDDDQDYNAGDADDTYTLSQESSENNVLVVPAKSEQQDETAEKKKKFVQVLSYFADLLTDEKYKDFRPPGQVSYIKLPNQINYHPDNKDILHSYVPG